MVFSFVIFCTLCLLLVSSGNLSCGLYELAKAPHVLKKGRSEIKSVLEKHNVELTYKALMDMTYLDQIITETVRKHPALAAITRISTNKYKGTREGHTYLYTLERNTL